MRQPILSATTIRGAYYPDPKDFRTRIDFVFDGQKFLYLGQKNAVPEHYVAEIVKHFRKALAEFQSYPKRESMPVKIYSID